MARKDAETTRRALLEAAFWSFYRNGYQGSNLDQIVRDAGVTKGALYHHFPDKATLAYAVIENVIRPWMIERWVTPISGRKDPIAALGDAMTRQAAEVDPEIIRLGCPLNNLAQEMAPLDEGFRWRLERVFQDWHHGITEAFELGQKHGSVRGDVDASRIATFITAVLEGSISVAKATQDAGALVSNVELLRNYLETLRPPPAKAASRPAA